MKRFIFFLTVVLLVALNFPLFASGIREKATVAAGTGSSVWRISKDGNTLFLGGSIHVLREADLPLPEEFDRAFYLAEILVLETDAALLADPEIMQYLLDKAFLPDNLTLRDILDSDIFDLLSLTCTEYGFSIDEVISMKPSMVMNILILIQIQEFGFIQQGVDDHYLEKARSLNKPVNFLESVQTQIDMLVSMGDGYENEYVLYSLRDMERTEAILEDLIVEWKNGTAANIITSLAEMKEQWPKIYTALITDRHETWLPQIEEYLALGLVCFIIAGNAHLHGADGLLQLLEDLGYTVEQF
jgi:hypothetical protein